MTNGISEEEILTLAASAEKGSEHPLGEAIVRGAEEKNLQFKELEEFKAIPGHGIEVKIDGKTILIGNKKLISENNIDLSVFAKESDRLAIEGKTPMYIAVDEILRGIIAVADTVKPSSKKAMGRLS